MKLDKLIGKYKAQWIEQADKEFPQEACGFVLLSKGRYSYIPCKNVSGDIEDFECDPEQVEEAEERGTIVAVFHSHCNGNPDFTPSDKAHSDASKVPYILLNQLTGVFKTYIPDEAEKPLLGREYIDGVMDCYTLAQDYYKQEFGIVLPDFHRDAMFWKQGINVLSVENFEAAGFTEVSLKDIQKHDGIIMQSGGVVADHCGVYTGDGMFLHHCRGRLSCEDLYSGVWQRNTIHIVRHNSLWQHSAQSS